MEENNHEKKKYVEDAHLAYKKQDEFFEHYYEIRKEVNNNIAQFMVYTQYFGNIITSITKLVIWTSNYLDDSSKLRKRIMKVKKDYQQKINSKDKDSIYGFLEEINNILQEIDQQHEKYELLPKPDRTTNEHKELEDFWRYEENISIREAKRAFHDMLMNHLGK